MLRMPGGSASASPPDPPFPLYKVAPPAPRSGLRLRGTGATNAPFCWRRGQLCGGPRGHRFGRTECIIRPPTPPRGALAPHRRPFVGPAASALFNRRLRLLSSALRSLRGAARPSLWSPWSLRTSASGTFAPAPSLGGPLGACQQQDASRDIERHYRRVVCSARALRAAASKTRRQWPPPPADATAKTTRRFRAARRR